MELLEKSKQANIVFHDAHSSTYLQQPHYRPENVARVRSELIELKKLCGGDKLLDLGCGMGFIIDIAKTIFPIVRGVDATETMLAKVDLGGGGDVKVSLGDVNALDFEDDAFDACTAHALLHHLPDMAPAIKEAARVLKSGTGWLYTGLDPNGSFFDLMTELKHHDVAYVQREITAVGLKDEQLAEELGIDVEVVRLAEPMVHNKKGLDADSVGEMLREAGFADINFHYHWFLGEGQLMHQHPNPEAAGLVRDYLTEILPASRSLFKYVGVTARKRG
jgi:ubiquinone/menaquinone biosynthesis C-methylase UbiE